MPWFAFSPELNRLVTYPWESRFASGKKSTRHKRSAHTRAHPQAYWNGSLLNDVKSLILGFTIQITIFSVPNVSHFLTTCYGCGRALARVHACAKLYLFPSPSSSSLSFAYACVIVRIYNFCFSISYALILICKSIKIWRIQNHEYFFL